MHSIQSRVTMIQDFSFLNKLNDHTSTSRKLLSGNAYYVPSRNGLGKQQGLTVVVRSRSATIVVVVVVCIEEQQHQSQHT